MTTHAPARTWYRRVRDQSWQNRSLVSAAALFPFSSSAIAVGDPSATRTVYLTTVALVLLGIGLAVLAWWLFRRTKPEPELFAPLEQMETRPWRKGDSEERQRLLDDARPYGARPVSLEAGADLDVSDEGDAEDGDVEDDDDVGDGDTSDTSDTSPEVEFEDSDDPEAEDAVGPEQADDDEVENQDAPADDATPATDPVERMPEMAGNEDDPTLAIDRASSSSPRRGS